PEQGDFFLPATLRRGDLVVTVGTHGRAPGLARQVRDLLDEQLDDAFAHWLGLLTELRRRVVETVPDASRPAALLEQFSRPHWLERLRHEEFTAVHAAALAELRQLVAPAPDPL